MAIKKEAVGSTTLMGTMNQVSVIWNFIAIKLTSEDQVVRNGYVMYLISNTKTSDLRLDGQWTHPSMWTLIQIGNKTLIVPSFLVPEVLQHTRLARKRRNLNFDSLSAVNPLLEQTDGWGAVLKEHAQRTEIEVPMSKLTLDPTAEPLDVTPKPKSKPSERKSREENISKGMDKTHPCCSRPQQELEDYRIPLTLESHAYP